MYENSQKQQTALLAAVDTGEYDVQRSVDELEELAKSAGAQVVGRIIQKKEKPDPATLMGAGRLEEAAEFVRAQEVDLVIFDHELAPAQLKNIEKVVDAAIIDRTTLILDIFAQRARTSEGRLQVELAQLKYRLPRLSGLGTSLSRLGGGIGTRGPGESKLESDRRHIRRRIHALEEELDALEKRRGLMHWYDKQDGVNSKVHSVVFDVESRDGQLWCVAECKVMSELLPEEKETLADYISGQASDGWGEGFEQRAIKLNEGELYVSLWNSENWSIQTEKEKFSPDSLTRLPDLCWSVLPGEGTLICIKRGESGYYPSDWSTDDREQNRRLADYNNQRRGITPAQEQAMLTGSMHGWDVPGADPKWYEEHQESEMGGMTLG